jgi:hypothetical protein
LVLGVRLSYRLAAAGISYREDGNMAGKKKGPVILSTPREHLPAGWPLPSKQESSRFEPIWARAFEIHRTAHDFAAVKSWRDEKGVTQHAGPREGILATSQDDPNYCDCYERAYQEFEFVQIRRNDRMEPCVFTTKRSIRLEA